jgi:hypothetical protein
MSMKPACPGLAADARDQVRVAFAERDAAAHLVGEPVLQALRLARPPIRRRRALNEHVGRRAFPSRRA